MTLHRLPVRCPCAWRFYPLLNRKTTREFPNGISTGLEDAGSKITLLARAWVEDSAFRFDSRALEVAGSFS
jgi:hypothetical protein